MPLWGFWPEKIKIYLNFMFKLDKTKKTNWLGVGILIGVGFVVLVFVAGQLQIFGDFLKDLDVMPSFVFQELRFKLGSKHSPTPEEVYDTLREALKRGDLETAANQFHSSVRDDWKKSLKDIKDNGLLDSMIEDLTDLKTERVDENRAKYNVSMTTDDGELISSPIVFVRDLDGQWKIKTLYALFRREFISFLLFKADF